MKKKIKPSSDLFPNPVALISVEHEKKESIITLAWVGTVCSNPPMVSISIRPSRYSHELVKSQGDFVLNIPTSSMVREINICGTKSGRNVDKWALCNFTKQSSEIVKSPGIAECPINLECKVKSIHCLGTHDMFVAEVVSVSKEPNWKKESGEMIVFTRNIGLNYGKVIPIYKQ